MKTTPSDRRPRWAACLLLAGAALGPAACRSAADQLQQIDESLTSLQATVDTTGQAWRTGQLSKPYMRTTLTETLRLLQQEQALLGTSPDLLADPHGVQLSQRADQLARDAAQLWHASQR